MNTLFAYYPSMRSIYLDWAASAPIQPEIPLLISDTLFKFSGNPSSVHAEGKNARKQIDDSRKVCAELLGTKQEQLVFTSGGTESNSIIMSSMSHRKSGGQFILSSIEHPSIYGYSAPLKASGFDVVHISANQGKHGKINPEDLKALLNSNTILVSIMTINNETGAIQPIEDLVSVIRDFERKNSRQIHIHADAVQTLGKIPFVPGAIDIDSASFSAHKIGGPKGTGLLFLKNPVTVMSSGGGQEFGIRPGTENTAGIIAFRRAMEISFENLEANRKHAEYLKSLLISGLSDIKGIKVLFPLTNNDISSYSPFILSATISPVPGEILVRVLSDEGIFISTGSACSSRNRKKQIRVLTASGVSEKDAAGSIRISMGWSTTSDDIMDFCSILDTKLSELRKYIK